MLAGICCCWRKLAPELVDLLAGPQLVMAAGRLTAKDFGAKVWAA